MTHTGTYDLFVWNEIGIHVDESIHSVIPSGVPPNNSFMLHVGLFFFFTLMHAIGLPHLNN